MSQIAICKKFNLLMQAQLQIVTMIKMEKLSNWLRLDPAVSKESLNGFQRKKY